MEFASLFSDYYKLFRTWSKGFFPIYTTSDDIWIFVFYN